MIDWLGLGDTEEVCAHQEIADWPDEEEEIWYLREKELGADYWSETDAAYIRLREVEKNFVCLGCGEERTIEKAERVGGDEGILLKKEMDDSEREYIRGEAHGGGFYNGFPEE